MPKLEKEIIIKTEIFVALYVFFRTPSETQDFTFYYSVLSSSLVRAGCVSVSIWRGHRYENNLFSSLNGDIGDTRGN